jgi:hypothetical protein
MIDRMFFRSRRRLQGGQKAQRRKWLAAAGPVGGQGCVGLPDS